MGGIGNLQNGHAHAQGGHTAEEETRESFTWNLRLTLPKTALLQYSARA